MKKVWYKLFKILFSENYSGKIAVILFCCAITMPGQLHADSSFLKRDQIDLDRYLKYYVDSDLNTGNMDPGKTLEKIKNIYNSGKFKAGESHLGVTRSRLWAVFNGPKLESEGRKFFIFNSERVEYSDLYFIYKDGTWRHYQYNPEISYNDRVIPYRKLVYPIEDYSNLERIFFSIKSDQIVMAGSSIVNETALLETQTTELLVNGSFYGILFALLIYNSFLLIYVGNKNYLYYILFVLAHMLIQASVDGHLHQFLFPENYLAARDFRIYVIAGTIFFSSLFTIHFLDIKKHAPKLYFIMLVQAALGFAHIPEYFSSGFFFSLKIATPFIFSGTLLSIFSGIYLFKKSEMAPYFTVAWMPLLFTFIILGLKPFNLEWVKTDGNLISKGAQIFEMLALSIALGQKFRKLRNTVTEKENELLKIKMNNLKNKLKPHFIMNTLGIALLFVRKETGKAEDLLNYLVHTYKYLLKFSDRDLVPLSDEIEFTRSYAGILKHKHSSTLSIHFDISGPIERTLIPPFTLQPLVENAYIHGIRSVKKGEIHIQVAINKGNVGITVTNTSDSSPFKRDPFENTTLGSVKKRIAMTFKNSRMVLEKKGKSTMACIQYEVAG